MAERTCIDCPAARHGQFADLLPRCSRPCALRSVTVAARAQLPARWFGAYALALVRRGVVVRQRIDAQGRATAVDVVGAGGLVPLDVVGAHAAYAAVDTMLCLLPREHSDVALKDALALHVATLDRVERVAEARARRSTRARVAGLLCAVADPVLALQQRDLAALLALRHESVCRALRAFEREGMIARSSGALRIVDRARLEAE
jgi:hypothetical protein